MSIPAANRILIDSNLLVLLIVGRFDRNLILTHRRLSGYAPDDFEELRGIISGHEPIVVTPNTLTEAGNLLAQHGQPDRSRLLALLRRVIDQGEEIVIASQTAARREEFERFGLTDSALLEAVSRGYLLLTADARLFAAALAIGGSASLFTPLRGAV